MDTIDVEVTINKQSYFRKNLPSDMLLIDFLHEELNLTGSKFCCGIGVCRACTVVSNRTKDQPCLPVLSCITPLSEVNHGDLTTVEGLMDERGELNPIQQTFLDRFSFQCGYCAPGFLMATFALMQNLKGSPVSSAQLDEVISDNCGSHLCRCTGYVRYQEAIRTVVLNTPGLVIS
jgi:aerobic-type carbon monoxide dehydrogenase small subunit (CoxS/CutS family)